MKDIVMTTVFMIVFSAMSVLGVILFLWHDANYSFLYVSLLGFIGMMAFSAANFYFYGKLKKMDINELEDANVKFTMQYTIMYLDDRKD